MDKNHHFGELSGPVVIEGDLVNALSCAERKGQLQGDSIIDEIKEMAIMLVVSSVHKCRKSN